MKARELANILDGIAESHPEAEVMINPPLDIADTVIYKEDKGRVEIGH